MPTTEKLYTKAATRKILGISRARYEQLIESGILPKPFAITPGARPLHTDTQIKLYEANLYRRAIEASRAAVETEPAKRIKPITLKPGESLRRR